MLKTISRILEFCLGLFFVASAASKVVDIEAFAVQISLYGVVKEPALVNAAAYLTIGIEALLGAVFLAGRFLGGAAYIGAIGLTTVFTGLIAYAWQFKGLEDCGCFGEYVKLSPGPSILKNIGLIGLMGFAGYGVRAGQGAHPAWRTALAGFSVAAIVALGAWGTRGARDAAPPVVAHAPADAPFAAYVFEAEPEAIDLGKGAWLVAMLSATCEHCMDSIDGLNAMHESAEVPSVVGLMLGEPQDIEDFRMITEPAFRTFRIPTLEFFKYIDTAPPRLIHVRDGRPGRIWDWEEETPSVDDIRDTLSLAE